jgi:phage shock protein A
MARANEALRPLWILQKPRKVSLVKLIKPLKSTVNQLYLRYKKMAENIAKIDEKIRELKRKKKTAENREKIKDQSEAIKAINQSLKNSKIKIEKITEIVGFLQEQESSGNWLSKWLAKQRAEK